MIRALLALLLALGSTGAFAQSTWTQCATEGSTCSISGPKLVRYGEPWNNRWAETQTRSGPFLCANASFISPALPTGDPSPGTGKRCEVMDAPAPVPAPAPSPPAASWTGEVTFEWTEPTTNTDGSPIILTPLNYEIVLTSRSSSGEVTLRRVTVAASPFRFTGLPPGEHCGRILTIDRLGTRSDPSEQACKTLVAPPPVNGPRVLAVLAGLSHAAVFGITATGARSSTVAGFVPVGTECTGPIVFRYRGVGYRRVAPATVGWWGTQPSANVAAPCQ